MAKRKIGDAIVNIKFYDVAFELRGEYRGTVSAYGKTWKFKELYSPAHGFGPGVAYDSPIAYDKMAESAVGFGSAFTTDNRGDESDLEGYPDAATADAIMEATAHTMTDQGDYSPVERIR